MSWAVSFSKEAEKFLSRNHSKKEEIFEVVAKSVKKLQGENVNIDIKKLKGKWQGFYRSRVGKIRVIIEFNFDDSAAFVENIDFRGNVYK